MTQKEIDYCCAVQRALDGHTSQEEADKATAEMYKASREMLAERKN
jgi:hypothetical protein